MTLSMYAFFMLVGVVPMLTVLVRPKESLVRWQCDMFLLWMVVNAMFFVVN